MENGYLKYPRDVVRSIAGDIDAGMVCFLDTDTMKYESVPGESYGMCWTGDHEELYREVRERVAGWKHAVTVVPPESWQSYGIMERFVEECIPDGNGMKDRLRRVIAGRKPFQNFKAAVGDSGCRQLWFDFKQEQLERFVLEQLIQSV